MGFDRPLLRRGTAGPAARFPRRHDQSPFLGQRLEDVGRFVADDSLALGHGADQVPKDRQPAEPQVGAAILDADLRASRALAEALENESSLCETRAVRELVEALPEGALLYVANSMPVRDLDAVLPARCKRLCVLSNRGASGIDGLLSSALGAAAAGEGPVTLLVGDLAFLHDLGGLFTARRHALPLSIVLLDNDGGGIFSHLPIA